MSRITFNEIVKIVGCADPPDSWDNKEQGEIKSFLRSGPSVDQLMDKMGLILGDWTKEEIRNIAHKLDRYVQGGDRGEE